MKNTNYSFKQLRNLLSIIFGLFSMSINGFSQVSSGPTPTYEWIKTSGALNAGSIIGRLRFQALNNNQFLQGAQIRVIDAATAPSSNFLPMDIIFETGTNSFEEQFRIMSNGNIGINTSTPSARLNIEQFQTASNVDNPLFKITGGTLTTPNSFTVSNQLSANRLYANLQGDFTVNKGNVVVEDENIIISSGRLMINTTEALGDYKALVNGSMIATEFWVKEYPNWPDYVFAPDYPLISLKELDNYIKINGHLPNMPPAAEVADKGFSLAELQAKSVEKIEELVLYIIEMERSHEQEKKAADNKIKILEERLSQLEELMFQVRTRK